MNSLPCHVAFRSLAALLPSLLLAFALPEHAAAGVTAVPQGAGILAVVAEDGAGEFMFTATDCIPDGKGSTTQAGKFIPANPVAEGAPVQPADAEMKLREAVKVEELAPGKFRIGKVRFDATTRTISLPAKINMRGGVIEYVLTTEAGKAHESMLTTTARPQDLHLACLLLGMRGSALTGAAGEAMKFQPAESVRISVSWETNGPTKVLSLAALLSLARGGPDGKISPVADGPWHYTGSRFFGSGTFAAEAEGSFISLIRDDSALVNNPDSTRDDDAIHVPNTTALPSAATPVTVIFQLPPKS